MIYDSSRNNHPYLVSHTKLTAFRLLWSFVLVINLCLTCCFSQEKNVSDNVAVVLERHKVAYIVAQPEGALERRMVEYLSGYLTQVTIAPAVTVSSIEEVPAVMPAIIVSNKKVQWPLSGTIAGPSDEAYMLKTSKVNGHNVAAVAGASAKGLKRGLQRLIIASQQKPEALVIPSLNLAESPWILKREWTLCAWEPSHVRGVFRNNHVDPRFNIYSYSKDELAHYVEMFDWFGFSGCQLTETCLYYTAFGSKDAAQEWLGYIILKSAVEVQPEGEGEG